MSAPILLLGANGQVGWELRRTLAPLGAVRALERADVDLSDRDALRRTVREAAPALIVNAAAFTAVDRAETQADLANTVNADAPRILAEEAKELGGGLVHFSTDYVFDGSASVPYRETDDTAPANAYGRSKLAGELAIRDVGGAHLILRTSWVYSMRGANFLLTVQRLAGELEELRIVGDQHGAPTWARAIAEATALILACCGAPRTIDSLRERAGVYHLTAGGRTSWHGFATAIVEWMRETGQPVLCKRIVEIATRDYPTPARRPANSLLDCDRLVDTFGIGLPDWREQFALCTDS